MKSLSCKAPPPFYASAGDSWAGGIMVSGCPSIRTSVRTSVRCSLTRYLRNILREFCQIWLKHPLGLKDELIIFWWSKIKVQRSKFKLTVTSQTPFSSLLRQYLSNALTDFLWICFKHPLGLKDELTIFWWAKVNVQGHCDLTTARFMLVNMKSPKRLEGISSHLAQTLTWTQGWTVYILVVKGQSSRSLRFEECIGGG